MANEPTIIGTSVEVGFPSGTTMSGIIRASYDVSPTADIEYIKDESNNDGSALVSNLGTRLVVDGVITEADDTEKGDIITIGTDPDDVEYVCEDVTRRHVPLATRISLTLYRPTAMDPTPEA
jgi:hypothetical protein